MAAKTRLREPGTGLAEWILTMRIMLYILGFLIFLGAVCYAATLWGAPALWVGIGAAALLGIGLMSAARTSSRRTLGDDTATTVVNKID